MTERLALQKLLSPRWQAAIRMLGWADPIYRWRIARAVCPNCKGRFFLVLRRDAFMTRCLGCRANATNLSLIPVVKQHFQHHPIAVAWEMSTYGATLDFLKRRVARVYESEYFEGKLPGEIVNGVRNEDVQNPSFADASLDLVTSNQVFEHVPDDLRGYAECFRILRPGGALLFTVPLYGIPATQRLAEIEDGRIVHHAEPEYHDSRASGPNTVPTFWHHSIHDIAARVASVGFEVRLEPVCITPSTGAVTMVVYATKPLPRQTA